MNSTIGCSSWRCASGGAPSAACAVGRRSSSQDHSVADGEPVAVREQQLQAGAGVDGQSVEEVTLAALAAAKHEVLVGLVAE